MPIIEKIAELQTSLPKDKYNPSVGVQNTLNDSGVEVILDEIAAITSLTVTKDVIERGEKITVDVRWNQHQKGFNRFVLSIRENTIAFIGDTASNQFIRLADQEIQDADLVESSIAKTFTHPQVISHV